MQGTSIETPSSDLIIGAKGQATPFASREFKDISQNYSDRLANAGRIRRGLEPLPERPIIVTPGVKDSDITRREIPTNFNNQDKPKRVTRNGHSHSYEDVFAVCLAIHRGTRLCDIVKKSGMGLSTVKHIKTKRSAAAKRSFLEIEAGAISPTKS